MRILAIVSGEYGDRHVANIRKNGPGDWTLRTWVPPRILPQVIDEPEEFLPASLPEADLVLAFQEESRAAQLIPDIAKLCKAKAVIASVDREEWMPRGLVMQLLSWLAKSGIVAVFPKPLCSLDPEGEKERASPSIVEFARHFGRPSFRLNCDDSSRKILTAEVLRDSVCGCARHVAEKLIGVAADDAEQLSGLAHHHYPCMASMGVDSEFNDTLMHVSGNIMKQSVAQALGPWRKTAYFTPDGAGGAP
jgi:hypothetical protein